MRMIVGSPHTRSLAAALVIAALAAPACTGNPEPNTGPQTTPGGRVSYEAGRVLEGVHEIQKVTAAGAALPTGSIPTALAGAIMIGAYKAGEAGEKLADVAQAYDAAVAAANVVDQDRLADEIQKLLTTVERGFDQPSETDLARSAPDIAKLILNVMTTVNNVRKLVPQLQRFVKPQPPAKPTVIVPEGESDALPGLPIAA